MQLRINRDRGIPAYLQIVEQVKLLVETGVLEVGQQLPTTQNLARQLNVHINTVNRAYAQLTMAGYIVPKQGSGTFIGSSWKNAETWKDRGRLRSIVEKSLYEAVRMGFSVDEFTGMCDLIAQTFSAGMTKKAALVECHDSWLQDALPKLSNELEMELDPFVLERLTKDAAARSRLKSHEIIITNISHVDALRGILNDDRKIHTFVMFPAVEVINRLVSLNARHIGVLYQTEDVIRRLENSFLSVGLDVHLEGIEAATIDSNLAKKIEEYDAVLVGVTDMGKLPEDASPKIVEMRSMIARESVELLKRELADISLH